MLGRFAVVIAGAVILAAGVATSAKLPTLDANGNRAPRAAPWPDNFNRDPAGEWSAYFDVHDGENVVHVRWPRRAFPSYGECIRVISTDAGFSVDFLAVMRVAKESFGDSPAVGVRCAPYEDRPEDRPYGD